MSADGSKSPESDRRSLAEALEAGSRAFGARDYAEAARQFARVVAIDGRCADAWYHLGNARWRRGDRVGAIEAYRRAVGEEPGRARAWQNLSTAHLSARAWNEAEDAASKSVGIDPSRVKAWNNLAVARFALGDRKGAETALRHAVEVDPGFAVAWVNYGRLLAELGRFDAASAAYRKAISLGETDVEVRVGLARVSMALGHAADAEALLKDAVRADPGSVDAWTALGDTRRSRAEPGPALEAYEAASAAAEDMSDAVRGRLAGRRRHVALELAAAALGARDRDEFTRAAERLKAASEWARGAPGEDDAVDPLVARCLRVAGDAARDRSSPEWIAPERVRGVIERALAPSPSIPGDSSGAPSPSDRRSVA